MGVRLHLGCSHFGQISRETLNQRVFLGDLAAQLLNLLLDLVGLVVGGAFFQSDNVFGHDC